VKAAPPTRTACLRIQSYAKETDAMRTPTTPTPQAPRRDPVPRLLSAAALLIACLALVFSMGGGLAFSKGKPTVVSSKPRPFALLRLDKKGKFPAKAFPVVAKAQSAEKAKSAEKLGGATRQALSASCPISSAIDL